MEEAVDKAVDRAYKKAESKVDEDSSKWLPPYTEALLTKGKDLSFVAFKDFRKPRQRGY